MWFQFRGQNDLEAHSLRRNDRGETRAHGCEQFPLLLDPHRALPTETKVATVERLKTKAERLISQVVEEVVETSRVTTPSPRVSSLESASFSAP